MAPTDPPPTRDRSAELLQAMSFAVDLYRGGDYVKRGDDDALITTVNRIFYRLTAPIMAYFEYGPVYEQDTGYPTDDHFGGSMTQLKDTQQVSLSVKARDAKGAEVADDPSTTTDDITWTSADPSIATVNPGADMRSADIVAGTVGSTVVTATMGSIVVTQAIDVIAGTATAMEISVGTPTEQAGGGSTPPPAPAPVP